MPSEPRRPSALWLNTNILLSGNTFTAAVKSSFGNDADCKSLIMSKAVIEGSSLLSIGQAYNLPPLDAKSIILGALNGILNL